MKPKVNYDGQREDMKGRRRGRPWEDQSRRQEDIHAKNGLLLPPVGGGTGLKHKSRTSRCEALSSLRPSTVEGRMKTENGHGLKQLKVASNDACEEKADKRNVASISPVRGQVALRDRPKTVAAERRRNKYRRPEKKKRPRVPQYNPWLVVGFSSIASRNDREKLEKETERES